jgi:hypothetical protein
MELRSSVELQSLESRVCGSTSKVIWWIAQS